MNTAVPWSIKDISREARETAADAARRAGVPVEDWLDTIIAERAAELGVSPAKAEGGERLRAPPMEPSAHNRSGSIATVASPVAAESPPLAGSASPPDALRIMSQRLADLETRASRSVGETVPSELPPRHRRSLRTDTAADPAIREAVAEIARRQAALDDAGPIGHAGSSKAPPSVDVEAPRRRHWRDGAGETRSVPTDSRRVASSMPGADAPPRPVPGGDSGNGLDELRNDLRQAIRDIDPRSDVQELNRHVRSLEDRIEAVAAIIPPGEVLSAIGEQTREVRDLLAAAAARSATTGTIRTADPPEHPGKADLDSSRPDGWTDVGATLDGVASGSALETIDRRIQDLSAKLDAGLGDRSSSPLLEDLAQRIQHIQASLGAPRDVGVDTRSLEALVRGIGERIETVKLASTDVDQFERMMNALSDKIERSRDPIDTQALEAQISRLGTRLEQSEASLSALDSVERTLGELFTQLEQTRSAAIDAAETAARTAARDTLRAAMQTHSGAGPGPEPAAFDEVRQVLNEVRDQHDAADRRTQSTLRGLHQTMEQLVEHLTRLDAANRTSGPVKPDVVPSEAAPSDTPQAPAVVTQPQPGPSYQERFQQERSGRRAERTEATADTLIEPGAGRKGRKATIDDAPVVRAAAAPGDAISPPTRDGQGAASYIAAARRAAQAAQASAAVQKQAKVSRGFGEQNGSPVMARAKAFLALRRRPILLSVAALVLLLGALEVVKVGLEEPPQRVGGLENPAAEPAPSRVAEQPSRGAVNGADASAPALTPDQAGAAQSSRPAVVAGGPPTEAGGPAVAKPPQPPTSSNPFLAGLDGPPAGQAEGLRKLAASGDPAAQYELGLRYAEGRTLNRDPKAAAGWFEKAATQGLAPAQYRIGSAYEKGIGVTRNPTLAMTWYARAAEAGNIKAMHNLAVMSADGSLGRSDYAKAASWFGKAAALGVRDSQFNLAILYAKGLGIEQSLTQSYTWFAIAAAQGDDDAGKKRDEVGSKLDAKSLATAKQAADAFRPGPSIGAANDVAPPPGGWDAAAPAPKPSSGAEKASSAKVTTM